MNRFSEFEQSENLVLSQWILKHFGSDFVSILKDASIEVERRDIDDFVMALMKSLCMGGVCVVTCLILLKKYLLKSFEISWGWKQFVGMGLLIAWKMSYDVPDNKLLKEIKSAKKALELVETHSIQILKFEDIEEDFLRHMNFDVIIPSSSFLEMHKRLISTEVSSEHDATSVEVCSEHDASYVEEVSKKHAKYYIEHYSDSSPT